MSKETAAANGEPNMLLFTSIFTQYTIRCNFSPHVIFVHLVRLNETVFYAVLKHSFFNTFFPVSEDPEESDAST